MQLEHCAELTQQGGKTLEEQKKREAQDSLVRRLQRRVLLLTKVPSNQKTKQKMIKMGSNRKISSLA